ncbi:hypothetical protein NLI96_g11279 [Meripilus lineatus]|uniref:Uncharacterized protein n=1 Tax=Meripilus lineatus TaxID=2056292 RepID=A0AAD5US20_9APHY|nr:hypothetical protein NLI96_g11279 [Physisporinus lineatus]
MSDSHDRRRRSSIHDDRTHDNGERKRRHRDKDKDKDRGGRKRKEKHRAAERSGEERRSVLTGKKIKLKVHKGADDIERDANRADLLQFLNSAYE